MLAEHTQVMAEEGRVAGCDPPEGVLGGATTAAVADAAGNAETKE